MRLLHAIERIGLAGHGDWAVLACAAMLHDLPDAAHTVAIIGSRADARRAASLGVCADARMNPSPRPWPRLGFHACVRDRGPFDHVLIWNGCTCRSAGRTIALGALSPSTLPLLIPMRDRRDMRRQWRRHMRIADAELAVTMIGHADSTHAIRMMLYACELVHSAGHAITAIIPAGPIPAAAAAIRLHMTSRQPDRVVITEAPEAMAMCASDIVLVCPPDWVAARPPHADSSTQSHAHTLHLLAAAASGVRVIASHTPRGREALDAAGWRGDLARTGAHTEMARCMLAAMAAPPSHAPLTRGANGAFADALLGACAPRLARQ